MPIIRQAFATMAPVTGTTTPVPVGLELRATTTEVQWRPVGGKWARLVGLDALAGTAGTNGTDGTAGATPELRATETAIEWRVGSGEWAALVPLEALRGPSGIRGPAGADGVSITGPRGADGTNAAEVELRVDGGVIQWRRVGQTWQSLLSVASLKGEPGSNGANGTNGAPGLDGRGVELQRTTDALQWRPIGGTWADLVPLSALTGPAGPTGTTLVGTVAISQTATVALTLGLREVSVTAPWAVAGAPYVGVVVASSINGAASTPGQPTTYTLYSVTCRVAGTLVCSVQCPALALGKSYTLTTQVYRLG